MSSMLAPAVDANRAIASSGGLTTPNSTANIQERSAGVPVTHSRPQKRKIKPPKPEPTREEEILARLAILDGAIKTSKKPKKIQSHELEKKELEHELDWLRHGHGNINQPQLTLNAQPTHANETRSPSLDTHSKPAAKPAKIAQTGGNVPSGQAPGSSSSTQADRSRSVLKHVQQPYKPASAPHSYGSPLNPQVYGDPKNDQYEHRYQKDYDAAPQQSQSYGNRSEHSAPDPYASHQGHGVPLHVSHQAHWSGIYNQQFEHNIPPVTSYNVTPMSYPQAQYQTPVIDQTRSFSPYIPVKQQEMIFDSGAHQMIQDTSESQPTQSRNFHSDPLATGNLDADPSTGPSSKGTPDSSKIRQPPSILSGGIPEPTMSYRLRASAPSWTLQTPQPTLLVVDLNGTLLHRRDRNRPKSFVTRPMADLFLEYVLSKFSLMIWSSAQPENVHYMVSKLFPEPANRNRLLAVWARDRFDLSDKDYNRKIQVYKRLEKVWADRAIQARHPRAAEGVLWDQTNTILLDDSKEKARSEPWNLCEIPEFTNGKHGVEESADTLRQVAEYLELCLWQGNVSAFMRQRPFQLSTGHHNGNGNGNGGPASGGVPILRGGPGIANY